MLMKLQPTCALCGTYLSRGHSFRLPDSAVAPTHSFHFRGSQYFCDNCVSKLSVETRGKLESVEGVSFRVEGNEAIPSKLFRSRQGFLNICQENHLHFHEVSLK